MGITFNHSILAAQDRNVSAQFFAELFGLAEPTHWGPFATVRLEDSVHLHFAEPPVESIQVQHYAFLVDDERFDEIYGRILERSLEHWADPQREKPGQINTLNGGRGVYFLDPAGHGLEILTRPE
jgi:catechol 2,3-dioxygenase-like lactoylglutathione lyase family enzyme